ncbi:MAG: DUF4085 family protein [Clostridia bacterium]|nr:DUF4085 family protein [Clostridia bacterium]
MKYLTKEWYKTMQDSAPESRKIVKSTLEAYWSEYNKNFGENPPPFEEYFDFHDSKITNLEKAGNDFIIEIDPDEGSEFDIDKIVFKNARLIECEEGIAGTYWIYDELYPAEHGFEIHILTERSDVKYLTLECENVEYYYNAEPAELE